MPFFTPIGILVFCLCIYYKKKWKICFHSPKYCFFYFLDFEKKADDKIVVAPVPDVEGRIYHVTEDMKPHLRQLRSEREIGQMTFPLDLLGANNSLGCELK